MRLFGRLLSVMIVLSTAAALCPSADAGAFTYSGKRKRVYCGVAQLIHSVTNPDPNLNPLSVWTNETAINNMRDVNSPDEFARNGVLFAKLDSLISMKPTGWTFENPLAATMDKTNPNYWLVPIASSRNLSRLDVLYFPGSGNISLTDEERENLRKFVDGGGVLWVDNASASPVLTFDASGPFFITQLQFKPGGGGPQVPVSRHHPLVSSPYWLSDMEVMSIGMGITGGWANCYYDLPIGALSATQPTSYDFLYQVVDSMDSNDGSLLGQPSVVANAYGSGRVVATANFVGKACLLREPYSLASLKLAYNIMAYASSWTDIRKGPRHTGASIDTLGSNKLVEKWALKTNATKSFLAEDNKETAPIIYKNTVFYTHGDTLYALDATGNNNYGMWGNPGSGGEVVIWSWTLPSGGRLSAPAVATVQNPDQNAQSCAPLEAVMVMSDAGTVYILNAFPLNPDGTVFANIEPLYDFNTQPGSVGSDSKWPSPPIYINGWFYAISGRGRLYACNPCLEKWQTGHAGVPIQGSTPLWQVPDIKGDPGFAATPRCGPAFGYMRGIYNGAIVGAVWWYNSPATHITHPQENDHLWAVPISVSNDRVRIQSVDSNRTKLELIVNFPGYIQAPDPTKPTSAVTVFRTNGVTPITVTDVQLNQNLAGATVPGYITITTGEAVPANPRIYASYSLTYGTGTSLIKLDMEIEPKSLAPAAGGPVDPSTQHRPTLILGSPAMGSDNMTYISGYRDAEPAASGGGSVLAYFHDGSATGGGRLKWHYFLHSGLNATTGPAYAPGTNIEIPGVIRDKTTNLSMINPQPSASPAISNGKVFVTVSGDGAGGSPQGALLCLKANPEFVIRITKNGGYDAAGSIIKSPKNLYRQGDNGRYQVKIWQPNLINVPSGAVPMMDARDVTGSARVDYDNGIITFSDFAQPKVQVRGGIETNTFSPSLPVWVYLDNVEVPIDWSTWGPGALVNSTPITAATSDSVDLSGWNNLLWYYVVPDSQVHSPPTVIGNTVYFVTDDGVLYALDAETGESKGQQTGQKPLWTQKIGTGTATVPNQAALSVAGSNGVLLVPGPDGLYAFTSTTTLVADNNRLLEVDGAGDVSWSADSITWPATTPSTRGVPMAVKQGPINKPGRARYASTGEILFANTGADQVAKIDKSGMVGFDGAMGLYARWIYEKFADPRRLLSSGQPTKLRGPTDAIMWQEIEPNPTGTTPPTSVVHCLIADSGNSRILDLVYRLKAGAFVKWDGTRIDPATNPDDEEYIDRDSGFVKPELHWVSRTDALNERYSYNSLQLVNARRGNDFCQDVWVASSDISSTGTDLSGSSPRGTASLGGAIMALGYRQRTAGASGVAAGNWDYSQPTSGRIVARCDSVSIGGKTVPIANPRYFEVADTPAGRSLLICDNYGVYQVDIGAGGIPPVVQHLWAEDYTKLRRLPDPTPNPATALPMVTLPSTVPLIASSVQRMPNHKWLITNSYVGSNLSGDHSFNGEVFEFDPAASVDQEVLWCSPRLEWVPLPAGSPPGALPTMWRQTNTNTYNLRQPKSAMRQ